MVQANLDDLTQAGRRYFGRAGAIDPKNSIFDIVIVGNAQVSNLYAANAATLNDLSALYLQTKDVTARRWGDATTVLASLVWTAWSAAGAPRLDGFVSGCSTEAVSKPVEIVGLPPVGGWTWSLDGGVPAVVDAGPKPAAADAGFNAVPDSGPVAPNLPTADAAVVEPMVTTEMRLPVETPKAPIGCGCSTPYWPLIALAVAVLRRRRET